MFVDCPLVIMIRDAASAYTCEVKSCRIYEYFAY
jgi:hypothetical protein